jgi:hypothetical protein
MRSWKNVSRPIPSNGPCSPAASGSSSTIDEDDRAVVRPMVWGRPRIVTRWNVPESLRTTARDRPSEVSVARMPRVGSISATTETVIAWTGWEDPPTMWAMAIGSPSSGKSPGLEALLGPLKKLEQVMRHSAEAQLAAWQEEAEVAKLAENAWKDLVKAALKDGMEAPRRPAAADPGPEPVLPRLAVSDVTVERTAVLVERQPRGVLMARDELAGWLHGMTRYSGGGSDRPFWLEAYGGRSYTVERMSRPPVNIPRLTIGVLGGIQPEPLKTLLIKTDDDGLLARFLPFWPNPAQIKRPQNTPIRSHRALHRSGAAEGFVSFVSFVSRPSPGSRRTCVSLEPRCRGDHSRRDPGGKPSPGRRRDRGRTGRDGNISGTRSDARGRNDRRCL